MSASLSFDPSDQAPAYLLPAAIGEAHLLAPLPRPLTPLVGRDRDAGAVVALLRREELRLLTLTGPGGVGKTRLSLRVAADLAGDFPDGVAFVALGQLADPSLVLPTIARAVGVREAGTPSLADRIAHALRTARLLLVLDNFEQVAAAAPAIAALLTASRNLNILVTSRIPLHVAGEQEFLVAPLGPPGAGAASATDLAANPAVTLFVQRAQSVRSSFVLDTSNAAAVAEVCRRLDGLPLAIELAAARSKVLSPSALLARMATGLEVLTGGPADQPERLQTMRAAIAWSHELLTDEERALFRRLAAFAGGCSLEAAEQVSRESGVGSRELNESLAPDSRLPTPDSVFDGIAALVDRSLLRQEEDTGGEPRFSMLETIRAFGLERLAASGEEPAIRRALATWCIALAEETEPPLLGLLESRSFSRLEAELGNLRATLTWLSETGDALAALRLTAALGSFWYFRGHLEEGRGWLERTLAADPGAPPLVRAKAMFWLGTLSVFRGDNALGPELLQESLTLYRQSGDRIGVAAATIMVGGAEEYRGNDEAAMARFDEALKLSQEAGEHRLILWSLINLADGAYRLGDRARSDELAREALALSTAADDRMLHAFALMVAAQAALERGDVPEAGRLFGECLELSRVADDRSGYVAALVGCAAVYLAGGRLDRAARLLGAADAAREALGVRAPLNHELQRRTERAARAALPPAAFAAAWDAGRDLPSHDVIAEARRSVEEATLPGTSRRESAPAPDPFGLTSREREVLQLLATGLTDREIGDALFISWRTAQAHVSNIFTKLGVSTRTAAVAALHASGGAPPGSLSN